jgi:hypothetical protein
MAAERIPVVALITDLGTRDPGVAQFKTAVLAVSPRTRFVDISLEVRPRDLLEAGFLLERCWRDFPIRTYFVLLVDQLLAAPRRPLLSVSMDYYYFAPDNGVLSFQFESDPPSTVYHVTAEHYIDQPVPAGSVHRDVYGRAVGWLTKGIDSSNFGEVVEDYVRLAVPRAQRASPHAIHGQILHVDRHGSLVTNVPQTLIDAMRQEVGADKHLRAIVKDKAVPLVGRWPEGGPEACALYGASGYLEIVAPKGEASKVLDAGRTTAIQVVVVEP